MSEGSGSSGSKAKKKETKEEAAAREMKAREDKLKADMAIKTSLTSANLALLKDGLPNKVVVHPLVLLSVVDHYARTAADGAVGKRAVGILLGEVFKGKVDVTNSYAVPFEEDLKDPTVWFLDHNYHEEMFAMFKKVSGMYLLASYRLALLVWQFYSFVCLFCVVITAKEKVIGWYSTGPKIRPADLGMSVLSVCAELQSWLLTLLPINAMACSFCFVCCAEINELIRKYTSNPVLCIIDVNPQDELEIPTEAYISVENVPEVCVWLCWDQLRRSLDIYRSFVCYLCYAATKHGSAYVCAPAI